MVVHAQIDLRDERIVTTVCEIFARSNVFHTITFTIIYTKESQTSQSNERRLSASTKSSQALAVISVVNYTEASQFADRSVERKKQSSNKKTRKRDICAKIGAVPRGCPRGKKWKFSQSKKQKKEKRSLEREKRRVHGAFFAWDQEPERPIRLLIETIRWGPAIGGARVLACSS